ncbi:hypothetical protein [Starkeya sp. ORNL1]|uniref:hypothetical protein n=1 Tax=Starkeya sp. ORNL1 TaxID=2709380 RepID=UPI0032B1942A
MSTHDNRTHEPSISEKHAPEDRSARNKVRRRTLRRAAADGIASVANRLRFLVGRDEAGRWLALEDHGLAGGIFASKEAALHYASAETGRRPGGVRLARRAISFRI